MTNYHHIDCELTPDKTITIETGKLAQQANGSVLLKYGDNRLLITCCYSQEPRNGIDFFPLTVDFEERSYAIGKIPAGYNRREGRPVTPAILASRLIDRSLRPLFPKGFYNDVNIVVHVLSADKTCPLEALAIYGASMACSLAGLPIQSPVGAVQVGLIDEKLIINPNYEELENSELNLVLSGNENNILMIEAEAEFVKEDNLITAIDCAQEYIKKQITVQKKFIKELNITTIDFDIVEEDKTQANKLIKKLISKPLTKLIASGIALKSERDHELKNIYKIVDEYFAGLDEDHEDLDIQSIAHDCVRDLEKSLMRKQILTKGIRIDGRKCTEVRSIWTETSLLPQAHGSAVFTRGETQALSVATLGSSSDAKSVDGIWDQSEYKYFHHYNFPAFSVGEARGMKSPGRREIGHGALAEKALIPSLPAFESFPYVIRVVTDILGSNGSSSMASTCGSSLALMDAGVPVKCPIGGIAMGLIIENKQCAILTDIQGVEDFLGDMDFKVAGSKEGITALQLDLKLPDGINLQILNTALKQALEGRIHIIDKMTEELDQARASVSSNAPQIDVFSIDKQSIGSVIGSGGSNIKRLIADYELTKIDIEDNGTVTILGTRNNIDNARADIEALLFRPEIGVEYKGKIIRIFDLGIMVEIAPNKSGLLRLGNKKNNSRNHHNNRNHDNKNPEDYKDFVEGEIVVVTVKNIDSMGRINLLDVQKA